jgi:amidase
MDDAAESLTPARLAALALAHGLPLDRAELGVLSEAAIALMDGVPSADRPLASLPATVMPPAGTAMTSGRTPVMRDSGRPARCGDDPYNAIVRWCLVGGAVAGSLSGMRLVTKDSIAIAGVPMSCGSALLSGFVPDADSTVVRRLLDAGAEIVAVANMDELAISGAGDSSCYGPTLNPFDCARTSGGSSGGSAVSLWYKGIDAALGTDQAGSVRIPASWCGVLGLKPTRGVVPYDGILGLDPNLDHVGVMSRSSEALARVFGTIAEYGQQWIDTSVQPLDSLDGITIGLLNEGFDPQLGVERATVDVLQEPINCVRELGAEIEGISLPAHGDAGEASRLIGFDGIARLLDFAPATRAGDAPWPALAAALGSGVREQSSRLSPYAKVAALIGWQLRHSGHRSYAAVGRLRANRLTREYDDLLTRVDLVSLPTTPSPARAVRDHLDPDRPVADRLRLAWSNSINTCQANLTGHPAISLPVAAKGGLPVGLMLVGARGSESLLLRLAALYERDIGWTPHQP